MPKGFIEAASRPLGVSEDMPVDNLLSGVETRPRPTAAPTISASITAPAADRRDTERGMPNKIEGKKSAPQSSGSASPAVLSTIPGLLAPVTPDRMQSDALTRRIESLDARVERVEAELSKLQRNRKAVVLSGDDAKAEQHDASIRSLQRSLERFAHEREVLEIERIAIVQSEADVAREATKARLIEATELLKQWLVNTYAPLAAEIAAGATLWREVTTAVEAFGGLTLPEALLRNRGRYCKRVPNEIRYVPCDTRTGERLVGDDPVMADRRLRSAITYQEEIVSWKDEEGPITPHLVEFTKALALPPATGDGLPIMIWPPNTLATT
jgi:hypothetical protein